MKARVLGEVQKQLREGGFWQPLAVSPGGQKLIRETVERERSRERPDRWDEGTCLSDHLHGKHVPSFLQEKAGRLRYRQTLFHCTALYSASLYCIFLTTNQRFVTTFGHCHLPNSNCSLDVFMSHFGHSHDILNSFIIITFVMMICDQ